MKGLTRREVLRGLVAGSALAIFPSLARVSSAEPLQNYASPFQRLNVLFHGLSVIEFGSDEVRVYLPAASPQRAYLAGTWMQEVVLDHGQTYRLSGVMTGSRPRLQNIDPKQNAVFSTRKIDKSLSFCTLLFPFPDFITPLRPLRKRHGKSFFTGSPVPVLDPETIPQIVAFSYLHPDLTSPLEFRPARWTPVVQNGVVNLHVWDAPVKTPSPQASRESFAQVAKMIGAPQLRLNRVYNTIKLPRPDKNPILDSLSCQEEWTLIERTSEPQGCGKHRKYHAKDDSGLNSLSIILY